LHAFARVNQSSYQPFDLKQSSTFAKNRWKNLLDAAVATANAEAAEAVLDLLVEARELVTTTPALLLI